MRSGEALLKASHPDSKAISERIAALKEKWRQLEQFANDRRRQLEDAAEACSVRQCMVVVVYKCSVFSPLARQREIYCYIRNLLCIITFSK